MIGGDYGNGLARKDNTAREARGISPTVKEGLQIFVQHLFESPLIIEVPPIIVR
jgi:hypothetical protein